LNASTSSSATPPGAPTPAEPRTRFRLEGRSRPYDPATQAIRPDLADKAEAHHHFAPHYAEPADWVVTRAATLQTAPDGGAEIVQTLPAGAAFALLDITGGWAWGYAVDGHRVGYVAADALAPRSAA
jgi:hypothetical protein